MSRWFRFYDDALNDPKVQRLPGDQFKTWVNLLCIASKNGGILPPLADIAFALRINQKRLSKLFDEFYRLQLLDEVELPDAPMSYMPHNWNARQFKSDVSNERVKRHRERQRNVTETAPETETETEQNKHSPEPKPVRTKYSDEFETKFWQPYPRTPTMAKSEAWKAWQKLSPEERTASCQAIEPYRQFLRSKPTLETVHACRFLSQKRFEGFGGASASAPKFDIRSSLI